MIQDESPVVIENDVIFYVFTQSKCSTLKAVSGGCEHEFDDAQISEARKYLYGIMANTLKMADDANVRALGKCRKKGRRRTKACAMIDNIMEALKALDTDIQVKPKKLNSSTDMNPEAMVSQSVVLRVNEAENNIKSNSEAIEFLMKENIELHAKIDMLIKALEEANAGAAAATAAVVEAAALLLLRLGL